MERDWRYNSLRSWERASWVRRWKWPSPIDRHYRIRNKRLRASSHSREMVGQHSKPAKSPAKYKGSTEDFPALEPSPPPLASSHALRNEDGQLTKAQSESTSSAFSCTRPSQDAGRVAPRGTDAQHCEHISALHRQPL